MNLRISKALIDVVDEMRRGEKDLPSRQEMIRRMVQKAVEEYQRKQAH